jgi:hypothetical protein
MASIRARMSPMIMRHCLCGPVEPKVGAEYHLCAARNQSAAKSPFAVVTPRRRLSPLLSEGMDFGPAHLVNRIAHVCGDVKAVQDVERVPLCVARTGSAANRPGVMVICRGGRGLP